MDKVGTFGMIRLCLPIFPQASSFFAPIVIAVSVVGILYGALLAIGQTDMLRLVSYTSISHFGFITLGIFAFTTQSLSGATLYMVTHGLTTAALLLLVGYLINRGGSKYIGDYGGVSRWRRCWPDCSSSPGSPASRCPVWRRSSANSWCCWAPSPATPGRRRWPRSA